MRGRCADVLRSARRSVEIENALSATTRACRKCTCARCWSNIKQSINGPSNLVAYQLKPPHLPNAADPYTSDHRRRSTAPLRRSSTCATIVRSTKKHTSRSKPHTCTAPAAISNIQLSTSCKSARHMLFRTRRHPTAFSRIRSW